uniref:mRNA export factor GLE1 n=1 Tax=Culex pipiens TaxID=7175 RepID=A0A8D8B1D7_CULPI
MSHFEDVRNLKTKNSAAFVPPSTVKSKSRVKSHFRNENCAAASLLPPPDQTRSVPNLKVTISSADSRQVDGPDGNAATVRLVKGSQKQEVKRLATVRRKLEQGQLKVREAEVVVKQVHPVPKQVVVLEDEDEPMLWEAIREQDRVAAEFEATSLAEAEVVNRRLEELSERLRRKKLDIELKEERKRAILAHKASFQTLLNVYMDTLAGYDGEFVASFVNQEKSVLDLIESFNQLLGANDGRETTLADVDRTAELCKQLERINTEVIDLRNQMMKERGLVQEVQPPPSGISFNSDEVLKFYSEIKRFYEQTQQKIQPLADDPSLFVYRKNLGTVVNVAVSTMSGSCAWIEAQFNLLDALLGGARVAVANSGTFVTTEGYPEARAYCASMLAEKYVHQADLLISNNPPCAFPIASVIVALWQKYPDFGRLLLAVLFRECPFLAPFYPARSEPDQDQADYRRSLGYRFGPDGTPERQIVYLKRMAALARLYGAIVASNLRKGTAGLAHPHGLEFGWRWICAVLNMAPLADICATLLTEVLLMAGHRMWHCYEDQFVKVLRVLYEKYVPMLPKGEGWPKARLDRLLLKIKVEGRIETPIGMVGEGFW